MPGKPPSDWSVVQKFNQGDRSMMVEPLDWKILELLPKQGTLAGGLYPIGESVPTIVKRLGGNPLTTSMVSSRVRILQVLGLAVKKKAVGASKAHVWQITPKGEEELRSWKQAQES